MKKVKVFNYEVFIQNGILSELRKIILKKFPKVKTFAIITDDNVAELYERKVSMSLMSENVYVITSVIPHGEESKSMMQFNVHHNWLAENQITRSDALIALGGGVVGDLTGFTAATYLRGIPFIQIPTTLLAMVDSSVGGKTGIDIPAGKNLVGAFHQPSLVLCDPTVLDTLSPEIFNDGCAEVIKHGMIRSESLLNALTGEYEIEKIIHENIKIKAEIVQKDEFDKNERQLLNFGHTIGHAIEKLSGYEISHGSAVAIGMSIITRAAVKKNLCRPECVTVLQDLLKKFHLPTQTNFSPNEIFHAALSDKKRMGDTITEVIPRELGECVLQKIPIDELLEFIEMGI